jgi:hypothetical protein
MNRRQSDRTRARSKNTVTSHESRPSSRTILAPKLLVNKTPGRRSARYLACDSPSNLLVKLK